MNIPQNLKKCIGCLLCSLLFYYAFSQSISKIPCYALAQKDSQAIELFEYNPDLIEWRLIGSTGKFNLKSITIDSENSIIYSVDKHTLGTLNPVTGQFTTIGRIGFGNGAFGQVDINNVYGLAWHPTEKILYTTHLTLGYDSLDMLLKVNPENGKIIQAGFDSEDYVLLEKTNSWSGPSFPVNDVRAIAFQPSTTDLYMLYKKSRVAILGISNITDGKLDQVLIEVSELDYNGICFDITGIFYGLNAKNYSEDLPSKLRQIDSFVGTSETLNDLPPNSNDAYNFLCMDCFKAQPESQFCFENLNLSIFNTDSAVYKAKQFIFSNDKPDQQTSYFAGETIHLENYFEAEKSLNFSAEIKLICE